MAGEIRRRQDEITWRDAGVICRVTLMATAGAVTVLAILRVLVHGFHFPIVLFLPLAAFLLLMRRPFDFKSRFRMILGIEAGLALPLLVARMAGMISSETELLLHLLILVILPLFWSVSSLRNWAWGKERPFG